MAIDDAKPANANKPTAANNLEEREEQVAAMTARAVRLRASPRSPAGVIGSHSVNRDATPTWLSAVRLPPITPRVGG